MCIACQNRWSRVIQVALLLAVLMMFGLGTWGNKISAEPTVAATPADSKLQSVSQDPLWDSPTSGPPLHLKYLPPGFEALIAVRPASLLKHPEAEKLFDPQGRVLGPLGDLLTRDLPAWIGVPAASIDQLLVAIVEGSDRPYEMSFVVRFVNPQPEHDLVIAWGNPRSTEFIDDKGAAHRIYKRSRYGFYFPPAAQQKVLVVIPPLSPADLTAHLSLLIADKLPTLHLELQSLLSSSDADRHVTIVGRPAFLLAEETRLFSGAATRLREPLREFLKFGDTTTSSRLPRAAVLSFHLGNNFFAELRLADPSIAEVGDKVGSDQLQKVAAQLQTRVKALPRQIKVYVFGLFLSPYAKNALIDFDTMVEEFAGFTRIATSDDEVVLRTYLPVGAAQHLALCTYLSLLESSVKQAPVVQSRPARKPTLEEKLAKKISLEFNRNPLEVTMQLLSEALGVEIQILGLDLQLDGITKNQSSGMNEQNKPGKEILLRFLRRAHPKLVYFSKPKEGSPDEEIIYISSQSGVARRLEMKEKMNLPPELFPPRKAPGDPFGN